MLVQSKLEHYSVIRTYLDRYRDLLNTCPHHGFETWRLVSQFYEGLTPKDRQMVKHFTNVGIGIETCLILALIMVLKHGDCFHNFMKG